MFGSSLRKKSSWNVSSIKILYVFVGGNPKGGSVQHKILDQTDAWINEGLDVKVLMFTGHEERAFHLPPHVEIISTRISQDATQSKYKLRLLISNQVAKEVMSRHKEYSFVYFRAYSFDRYFYALCKEIGDKVCIEHQSKEIPERLSFVKENLSFSPSKLSSIYSDVLIPVLGMKKYQKKILRRTMLGIGVTSELCAYEQKVAGGRYRTACIGNGISTSNYRAHEYNELHSELRIFALIGANTSSPTHGIDRLIESVRKNDSKFKINLSIYSRSDIRKETGKNYEINHRGFLPREDLNKRLDHYHLAVGGLASFRKGIKFGSALKVREYCARGFPILMASIDEDVMRDDLLSQYMLFVPNNETLISFSRLEDRIRNIMKDSTHPKMIRSRAEKTLDWSVKAKQLKTILKRELAINRTNQ